MPPAISIELTNRCNLSCPECASGSGLMKREQGFMEHDLYEKIITELQPYLYYVNLYFQGEPMLHPRFFSFLNLPDSIYSVVSTNGHYLSEENSARLAGSGLTKLIVSLDGMDQTTYKEYRKNGNFDEVTGGIRNVSAAIKKQGSGLKLEIQFLVSRINEHQMAQVRKFAGELNASVKFKSMQVLHTGDINKWLPSDLKFRRYKTDADGQVRTNSSLPDRCMRLWFSPVVTWDGKVLPCCFDKDAEFVMGDMKKESFRTIWNGRAFEEFRKMVLQGRKKIGICRNCTSGINLKIAR